MKKIAAHDEDKCTRLTEDVGLAASVCSREESDNALVRIATTLSDSPFAALFMSH